MDVTTVTLEKDAVTDCHSCKTILSRLRSFCACHAKRGGVTFAPTLGSRPPLPPPWLGASATPHEVGANATPVPSFLAFYLASILTSYLASFLASILTLSLDCFRIFYLASTVVRAFFLAFYLTSHSGTLSGIYSDILSDMGTALRSGARTSGIAHWDLTEIWSLRLRSVEVRDLEPGEERRGEESRGEERRRRVSLIKSRGHHKAGGEWRVYHCYVWWAEGTPKRDGLGTLKSSAQLVPPQLEISANYIFSARGLLVKMMCRSGPDVLSKIYVPKNILPDSFPPTSAHVEFFVASSSICGIRQRAGFAGARGPGTETKRCTQRSQSNLRRRICDSGAFEPLEHTMFKGFPDCSQGFPWFLGSLQCDVHLSPFSQGGWFLLCPQVSATFGGVPWMSRRNFRDSPIVLPILFILFHCFFVWTSQASRLGENPRGAATQRVSCSARSARSRAQRSSCLGQSDLTKRNEGPTG